MEYEQKLRENRLRRKLRRLDLKLVKYRIRTPEDPRFGRYVVMDSNGIIVLGGASSCNEPTLEDVESWVKSLDN